jgi:hypothetical protein
MLRDQFIEGKAIDRQIELQPRELVFRSELNEAREIDRQL